MQSAKWPLLTTAALLGVAAHRRPKSVHNWPVGEIASLNKAGKRRSIREGAQLFRRRFLIGMLSARQEGVDAADD